MDEASGPILVFNMTMDQVLVPPLDMDPQMTANRSNSVIASALAALWRSEAFMDVELYCAGNVVVKAHKLVLAAISPLFRQLFLDLGPFLEVDYAIVLADVEAEVLREFLDKLYSACHNESSALIHGSIAHLKFSGEPLKGDVEKEATAQLKVAGLIKDEPFDDLHDAAAAGGLDMDQGCSGDEEPEEKGVVGRKAKIWQFFEAVSKDLASCLMCQQAIKTVKGCTSGLTRHVSRFHPDVLDETFEAKEEPADEDFDPQDPASKLKKSKVWNFFERIERDISKCKTCSVVIKTQKGNTSGMSRHLFRAHIDIYTQLEAMREKDTMDSDDSDEDDDNFSPFKGLSYKQPKKKKAKVTSSRKRSNQKRSKVWQFFTQQSDGSEAKCNSCDMMIKTDTGNTSGLVSHLRSSHPEEYDALNAQKDTETKFATSGARNSPVWRYYTELGSNRVKCNKCETVLKYYYGTTSGLLRHLRRTHIEEYDAIKNEERGGGGESFTCEDTLVTVASVDSETIWKYFHRIEESDKANCVECMAEISNDHENLVTSCEEHLRGSHTDLLEQYESQRKAFVQELIKTDKTAIKRRYTSRVVASAIWSYFKKTEDAALNQCLTCLVEIDCSQNSTAMVKHLEESHPDQHDAFKKTSGIEAKDIKKPSAIWNHFETTSDPKKHKCIVSHAKYYYLFKITNTEYYYFE